MHKIKTIILKEWAEVFRNQLVVFSVIFMPLLLTAIPLVMIYTMRDVATSSAGTPLPPQFVLSLPPGLSGGDYFLVYMVSQFMLLFMLTPLMVPVNIAAYSIVGEKTTHSLEPLLATPITTAELLAGKNMAAAIPAVVATWGSFVLFAVGAKIMIPNPAVFAAILDPMWLLAVLVVGPLLAILSVNFSLMVSSRVNDPRVAEQLSAVVMLPLLLIFFGQLAGVLFLNRKLVVLLALGLLAIDVLMVYLAVRLFQRETILTRWR
jgi:ABC-2 type transport system permease protein